MSKSLPREFGLVIVGDEILSGKRADKHMPKAIELLAARGLQLAWAEYVGDSPERITATLKRAFEGGGVVFSCGGIGATPDDHTRQCAARALEVELALHPQAEALIRERMQDIAREQGTPYELTGRTTSIASTWACSPWARGSSRTRTTRSPASAWAMCISSPVFR